MKTIIILPLVAAISAQSAFAADPQNGQRIAEARCSACHIIGMSRQETLSNSPPFVVIEQKFSAIPEALAFEILNPHAGMNLNIERREAEDVAAYINCWQVVS